ncbi:GNAT family N-acetyltransferase [Planotetraspora sp. A-T 1434]|uniref:GNAT family N-acetyltransferase n=1 Tax=Planotetraspora sp. A-T 1434 TaxID=2979219 RepID=UPI0021C0FDDE|nr:GNAT family N-acetyltransferase [Planotetraspora sp. A-T 1434]MCT9934479.1 GNAT family N-acetyltransferase [Planotetraspora sp. A-T 1434]
MKSVVVCRLTGEDWKIWREVRLAALADSPGIFHGDVHEEKAYSEEQWRVWTEDGVKAVAFQEGAPVGVAAGRVDAKRSGAVELFGMWVHPHLRGARVAERLAHDVVTWAQESGSSVVELWVIAGNDPAERLYRRIGFEATGQYEVHPTDPNVRKYVMAQRIADR